MWRNGSSLNGRSLEWKDMHTRGKSIGCKRKKKNGLTNEKATAF